MEPSVVVVRWARIPVDDGTPITTQTRRDESNRLALLAASVRAGQEIPRSALTRRCGACGSRTHGRPELAVTAPHGALPGASAAPAVTVSIARGAVAAIAAVAFASGPRTIGIDLECRSETLSPGFGSVVMGDDELARHSSSDDALLRTWVRKEAVVKAAGTGLDTDPRDIVLDGLELRTGPVGPWQLVDLDIDPQVIVTLAIRGVGSSRVDVEEASR